MTKSSAARDYAAEYLAARIEREQAKFITERGEAEAKCRKIDRAADRAGVYIDIVELGEQARLQVHGN